MSHFWWNLYKRTAFDASMRKKLLILYFTMSLPPMIVLGGIGYIGTTGILRTAIAVVVVFSFVVTYVLTKESANNMTWLLNRLLKEAKKVESGDLRSKLDVEYSQDEIGHLTYSFKKMLENLRSVVIKVVEASTTVSASSQELAAGSEEMNASTEEIASSIQKIAETTQNQSVQINQAVNEIKSVAKKAKVISQNAQSAHGSSDNLLSMAKTGGELSQKVIDRILRSNEEVNVSTQKLKKLEEESKQIEDIVKVITGVADQTNLLAINAAIEAARAGEHGRGFAVVADEVRKLAEESSKSADEISHLIESIQKENKKAVETIEKNFQDFINITEMVKQALNILKEMNEGIESSNGLIREISTSALEQAESVDSILKTAEEITAGLEDTASAVEEVSVAAEEQAASTEELSSSAQSLANLATDLTEIVSRFKINGAEKIGRDIGKNNTVELKDQSTHQKNSIAAEIFD